MVLKSLLPVLLTSIAYPVVAQELEPPAVAQAKVAEWIKTKQLISAEKSDWAAEKQMLTDLTEIRKTEIGQLDELVKAAGERVVELEAKEKDFAQEEVDLKTWRAELEREVLALEKKLRPLVSSFPMSLRERVEEQLIRLEEADPEAALQNRSRDVILILQAFLSFQQTVTVDNELREVAGEKRELDLLYLGMSQAFYVDQSGQFAGYGVPVDGQWVWTEESSLASKIRLAIEVQTTKAPPQFVELPLAGSVKNSN